MDETRWTDSLADSARCAKGEEAARSDIYSSLLLSRSSSGTSPSTRLTSSVHRLDVVRGQHASLTSLLHRARHPSFVDRHAVHNQISILERHLVDVLSSVVIYGAEVEGGSHLLQRGPAAAVGCEMSKMNRLMLRLQRHLLVLLLLILELLLLLLLEKLLLLLMHLVVEVLLVLLLLLLGVMLLDLELLLQEMLLLELKLRRRWMGSCTIKTPLAKSATEEKSCFNVHLPWKAYCSFLKALLAVVP